MDELEQIQQQIAELQKKAQELAQAKRQPILEDIKNKIKLYGFTARELGLVEVATVQPAPMKKPVAIKYRNGDDAWTGRGMKPKWVMKYIEGGGKLEDLLVK